jgi:uncharacterized protein with GYD domain
LNTADAWERFTQRSAGMDQMGAQKSAQAIFRLVGSPIARKLHIAEKIAMFGRYTVVRIQEDPDQLRCHTLAMSVALRNATRLMAAAAAIIFQLTSFLGTSGIRSILGGTASTALG